MLLIMRGGYFPRKAWGFFLVGLPDFFVFFFGFFSVLEGFLEILNGSVHLRDLSCVAMSKVATLDSLGRSVIGAVVPSLEHLTQSTKSDDI